MREQFEKLHWVSVELRSKKLTFNKKINQYACLGGSATLRADPINLAWYAWQARVPDGYVVVPKEPSAKTLEAGSNALGKGKIGFATYMDVNNSYKVMIESEK